MAKPAAKKYDEKKEVSESIKNMISKMPLEDEDENALKVVNIRYLENYRRLIYAAHAPDLSNAEHVLSVECVLSNDDDANDDAKKNNDNKNVKDDDQSKDKHEKIIIINENSAEIIEIEDKITMEDLSPSQLIEYTFHELDGPWFLAPMSKMSLEGYRKSKFKNWKHMMEFPDCEAAFKRLLNIGLITNMFDFVAFPSPDHEKADYEVKDDHGKTVQIPRPVEALRVWNANTRLYEPVEAHLDGAPYEKDAGKYWEDMLNKFKAERGAEYIDDLLKSFEKGKAMDVDNMDNDKK